MMNVHGPLRALPPQELLRHSLLERARTAAATFALSAESADAEALVSGAALRELHRSGLTMAPFDASQGGEGLLEPGPALDLAAILRLIGAADLSIARLFEGHVNAIALVSRYGTEAQVEGFAHDIAEGALSGVWGADDAKGLHAHETAAGWHLKGRKILASGAGLLTRPLVTATADMGQLLFMLDLKPGERADISGWTAQGMRASATGAVELSGLTLSPRQLIGAAEDFTRQPYFSGGAWRFCAVHLGAMERLTDLFREHLLALGRDGDPYQLQRVARCVAAAITTRFWVEKSAYCLACESDEADSIVALANLTRTVTERSALDILEEIHRGIGLPAFIRPNPIERISRDLSTYLRQPAPDLAMSNVARSVLASSLPTHDLWSGHES